MNLLLLVAVSLAAGPIKPSSPAKFSWDFSKSHRIEQIGWPKAKMSPIDVVYPIEVNDIIKIDLPDGRRFDRFVQGVTFERLDRQLTSVGLVCEPQTLDEVFVLASSLATKWNLPQEGIVRWKRGAHNLSSDALLVARPGRTPDFSIEIRKSYDRSRPFYLTFAIDWNTELFPRSTTHPTSSRRTRACSELLRTGS